MPVKAERNIKDFFKPFVKTKNPVLGDDIVEEVVVVTAPRIPVDPSPRRKPSREGVDTGSDAVTRSGRSKSTRTGKAQLDGPEDDTLSRHSLPSSRQKSMTTTSLSPSPPPRATTVSFASTTSLSTQRSSRRVVQHGVHAVTNSDSGSVGSESDELEDLSAFLPVKRRKLARPEEYPDHAIEIPGATMPVARQSTRLLDRGKRYRAPKRSPSPPQVVYRHSLAHIVKQNERRVKTEARIAEAEAAVAEAERRIEVEAERARDFDSVKMTTLEGVEDGGRIRLALERTEAYNYDHHFYFFHGMASRAIDQPFPSGSLSDRPWTQLLRNAPSRTHAFVSGLVAEIAAREPLHRDVVLWMRDQLVFEQHEELREAYVETIRACATRSLSALDGLVGFRNVYDVTDINDANTAKLSHSSSTEGPPPGFRQVVEALSIGASGSGVASTSDALVELCLANTDANIRKDLSLCNAIENGTEAIISAIPEAQIDEIFTAVQTKFLDSTAWSVHVKSRAVATFPAHSERSHDLRRRLALYLIHETAPTANDEDRVAAIIQRLKHSSEFAISDSTDYALLRSLVDVLNIAIDVGLYLRPSIPSSTPSGPFVASATAPTNEEKTFNRHVDALAAQLRLMSSRIRDAGTSHLRRIEAKSALEQLTLRLEHAVRTRPKPRKSVFGGGGGGDGSLGGQTLLRFQHQHTVSWVS